jgi:hypothetical protein
MPEREPRYRIERIALEEAAWQWFVNCFRRLLFLPIKKTGEERYREVIEIEERANEGRR